MPYETSKAEAITQKIMDFSKADETEVFYNSGTRALTRFSENEIHQNVSETDANIMVRVAIGNKIGVANTNVLDDDGIKTCVSKAYDIAEKAVPNEEYAGMPGPSSVKTVNAFDEATASFDAVQRAEKVKGIIDTAKKAKMTAAGSFMVNTSFILLANSHGVNALYKNTGVETTLVTSTDNSSGYSEAGGRGVNDIDVIGLSEDAVKRADISRNARDLKPGKYDVVLEGYCISDIMGWMSFVLFNTKAVIEGRSPLASKMGEKIMGDNISITDNAYHPAIMGMPFDFEGTARQSVKLIDKGVATNLLYDTVTSKLTGKPNTGHALPSTFSEGPIPLYTVFDNGDSNVPDMISSLERGIYVSRFHYINGFVDPMNVVFTGMTRDGTFWVEDGEIKFPVKNLRWTQSMLEAFSNVKKISKDVRVLGTPSNMMTVAPAMLIEDFNITGATE